MYREQPSTVPGAVLWSSHGTTGEVRVLPDGCLDLLWFGDRFVVAGPDTSAHHSVAPPGGIIGLRFAPGVGPGVLGLPAVELRDARVDLDAIWPAAEVRRLTERARATSRPGRLLEDIAAARLAVRPPEPAMLGVASLLRAGASVARAAELTGLSERQLHRRSDVAFGYGPKTLARILRLDRALALARTGVPAADCAHRAGFADQAHLARDVRSLTGTTLTGLLS